MRYRETNHESTKSQVYSTDEEMANNGTGPSLQSAEGQEEYHPSKTLLHRAFDFITFLACGSGFLMCIGQIVGIYFYKVGPIQLVLRIYVIVMCIMVMMNELQFTKFIRDSAILRMWISRGMFYTFVGVLGMEENDAGVAEHKGVSGRQAALQFVKVVALLMLVAGLVYFVMGCLCIHLVKNRVVADYEQRCKDADDRRRLGIDGAPPAPSSAPSGAV